MDFFLKISPIDHDTYLNIMPIFFFKEIKTYPDPEGPTNATV